MARLDFLREIRPPSAFEWTRPGQGAAQHGPGLLMGRFMADNSEPIAILLIGTRINRWRSVGQWLPVFLAMPRMLRELAADPESGLLGYRMLWGPKPGQVTVVQYWRRAGDIRAFAHNPERTHLPAQDAFWKRYLAGNGAIGIWHEMLSVRAGAYQCLYGDMPPMGIGAIAGLASAVQAGEQGGYAPGEDPAFAARST